MSYVFSSRKAPNTGVQRMSLRATADAESLCAGVGEARKVTRLSLARED
jgi:hypothetical protein